MKAIIFFEHNLNCFSYRLNPVIAFLFQPDDSLPYCVFLFSGLFVTLFKSETVS